MTTNCKKCGWQVEKVDLSEEAALEIWGLLIQDAKLFAIKKLKDEFKIDLGKAKGVMMHFNPEFGKCHNCNYSKLDREYMECPKCKSFNYNLKVEPPFNKDFCSALEYSLDFSQFEDENIKSLWCDGVDHLPADIKSLSIGNLQQKPFIKTKAWIGKDGQGVYEMTIHLGPEALSNYIKRQDLHECIPDTASDEWIKIDTERKEIEIRLK
jgi:predicted Zn-ribbon and HTH transcriptional regulator